MKEFLKRNKITVALAAVLVIFTVLLCIPATIKVFAGVFGYAAYLYLVLGYVGLILRAKKIKLRVKGRRLALYIITFACALMTLHVGLCGASMVNGGFGTYVGGTYDNPTAAGVIFSLISLPLVLPCKYIASVVIFFVLTALCGFFVIRPFVFASAKKVAPAKKEEEEPKLYNEEVAPEENTFEKQEQPAEEINTLEVAAPAQEEPKEGTREYAYQMLFGKKPPERSPESETPPPVPTSRPAAYSRPASKYNIVEGIDATVLPPDVEPYTNNYLNKQRALNEQRERAREQLFSSDPDEDYRKRYENYGAEKTVGQTIEETMSVNPYIPSRTIFESAPAPAPVDEAVTPVVEELPEAEETEEVLFDSATFNADDFDGGFDETEVYATTEEVAVEEEETEDEDGLPTVADTAFLQALNANAGVDAPAPLETEEETDKTAREERVHVKAQPVTIQPPKQETPPPVKEKRPYVKPKTSLLQEHTKEGFSPYVDNYTDLKEVFEVKLKNFNIDVTLIDAVKGPTITLCILELSDKCPISKVFSIRQDITRLLRITDSGEINIVPKIPGTSYFGIEVPNSVKGIVSFKEVICSAEYANAKGDVVIALGKTNSGKIVVEDVADMPHALVAGSTGSGKSVCINAILASILCRYSPDEVKLILIDLKYVELANYNGLPHMLFKESLNEIPDVVNALKWLKEEAFRRFSLFKELRVRNLNEYNSKVEAENRMPRIITIIDEASELMTDPNGRKVLEQTLSSLARVARAAGVHMIFATQNPVREVITGEIQNNLNTKIAFAVNDYTHSMVILKAAGAEKLLGKGDMLIKKGGDMQRAQCAFISTEEIDALAAFIKDNNDVDFDDDMIERILHGSKEEVPLTPAETKNAGPVLPQKKNLEDDEGMMALAKEALRIFVETNKVSATYIQRRFSKGYNTVANVMDYLEEKGYIGPQINNKRELRITKEEFFNLFPDEGDGEAEI